MYRNYTALLLQLENNVLTITINRPEKLNALNAMVFTELNMAVNEIHANPDIRAAVITGAGTKAFVAGADITEFSGLDKTQAKQLAKKARIFFIRLNTAVNLSLPP